jgi:hypothetical protein
MSNSLFARCFNRLAQKIDQSIGWHKLPTIPGLFVLSGLRNILREQNLYDTYTGTREAPMDAENISRCPVAYRADGRNTDFLSPLMGSSGSRFGRNIPLSAAYPDAAKGRLQPLVHFL